MKDFNQKNFPLREESSRVIEEKIDIKVKIHLG